MIKLNTKAAIGEYGCFFFRLWASYLSPPPFPPDRELEEFRKPDRPWSRPLRGLRPLSDPPDDPRPRARGDPLARSTVTLYKTTTKDKQGKN